jgi:hypothetical protein
MCKLKQQERRGNAHFFHVLLINTNEPKFRGKIPLHLEGGRLILSPPLPARCAELPS